MVLVSCAEARERCLNIDLFNLLLPRYWWKGNPVLDVG